MANSGVSLLIVDCSINRDFYRPDRHWQSGLNGQCSVVDVIYPPRDTPDSCSAKINLIGEIYSHVILTGSEANATGDEHWYSLLDDIVKLSFQKNAAFLGSCFGHQIVVRVLTDRKFVRSMPRSRIELGWTTININENGKVDPLLSSVPFAFCSFVSHFQEVHSLPAPWRVLATSEKCDCHVIRYGENRIWGIQAHPEIKGEDAHELLEGFARILPEGKSLVDSAFKSERASDEVLETILLNFCAS